MSSIWRSLLRDERGFVITAELVLISSILVLGLVVALNAVKTAIAGELGDVAGAIGSLNQSYYTHGFHGCCTTNGAASSRTYGSAFLDQADSSDEQEADFATGLNGACTTTACVKAPCNAANGPGPCATPGVPCVSGCGTPCGSAPCGGPCGSGPCGAGPLPYGPGCGGGCGQGGYVTNFSGLGMSVPPVICPPGPAPFTGTDPFAPGAVSPQNMLLQGISYGGVCAPPVSPQPQPELPAPGPTPSPVSPMPQAPCNGCQTSASLPAPGPAACESTAAMLPPPMPLPIPAAAAVY